MKKGWIITGAVGLVAWGLLLGLFVAARVGATGSLAIPNTIAAQPTGDLQASLLDTNWTTIANYVNAREITRDTLSNRPAAGTAGRYYFATDESGGTLYVDNGVSWSQIAPAVNSAGAGAYSVRRLAWATGTSTNTTYNGTADLVVLRNPETGALVSMTATTTVSNSIIATSPAVNARDSSTAFSASSWVHFYYIWNGSTLGSLSSACAPSDTTGACGSDGGPALPSTYTHWAYVGPVYLESDGTLRNTRMSGSTAINVATQVAMNGGVASTFNNVDLSTFVPPNAVKAWLMGEFAATSAGGSPGYVTADIAVATPAIANIMALRSTTGDIGTYSAFFQVPNVSQAVQYRISSTGNGLNLDLYVTGYDVPNGGE